MSRLSQITRLLATALVAVVLVGILTPLCTMAACDKTAVGTCSDFQPACGDCPEAVVMKHTHDDALRVVAPPIGELSVVAQLAPTAEPATVSTVLAAPVATASPPPLDPLGVRLTI